jgi:hypothetical protein
MSDTADEADTKAVILDLLQHAAEAHGVYEAGELGGVHDVNWPQWYAEHMTARLRTLGYRIARLKPD